MTTIDGHKVGRIAEAIGQVGDHWVRARVLDGDKMFVRITVHDHDPTPVEHLDKMSGVGTSVKKEWLREIGSESPEDDIRATVDDVEDWLGEESELLRRFATEDLNG